jgi:hypothetical protein
MVRKGFWLSPEILDKHENDTPHELDTPRCAPVVIYVRTASTAVAGTESRSIKSYNTSGFMGFEM